HDDAVPDRRTALNNAAYSDHASFQMRVRDYASIRNDCLPQGGTVDFASRQKAWVRVDRRLRIKEAVIGHHVGEIQVRLIKSPDCSDVFPVTLKDKRADMPIFDR